MNLEILKNISRLNGYRTFMAEFGVKLPTEISAKAQQIKKKLQVTLEALEKQIKESKHRV